MLTLGIPASGTMALMLGALMIHGIAPGPTVMTQRPDLFWGLIVSMWIGNLMLVILNLPLIGLWTSLLRVPYRMLFPAIIAFSCIGIYSLQNNAFELYLTAFRDPWRSLDELKCPAAPCCWGSCWARCWKKSAAGHADVPRRSRYSSHSRSV
jgi:TctA family transporter